MKQKIGCILLFFLLILSVSFSPDCFVKSETISSANRDYWAIFITVGEPKRDKKNTEELYTILTNNGWNKDNIYFLEEKDATKEAILEIPNWLNCKGLDKEDVVLFYFSLHGGRKKDVYPLDEPDGMDEFLIAYKKEQKGSNNTICDNTICDEELAASFQEIISENIVIIIESCYSGGMIDGSCDLKKSGRIILTSSKADESSYPIFLRKSWLFPYYLIKGLEGRADEDSDGYISVEETFRYAKIRIIRRSTLYGLLLFIFHKSLFIQHPQLYDGWPSDENNQKELDLIPLD